MKNLSVILSKKYTEKFYELPSLIMDKKEVETLKKTVSKYEDVSYIKEKLNDSFKDIFVNELISHKDEYISSLNELKNKIDQFYDNNLANKEIIDVPTVKRELQQLDKELLLINNNIYLSDINPVYEMKNNINVELDVYVAKHKSEEYMDMSIFHKSVTSLLNEVKKITDALIEDSQKNVDEYYEAYIQKVYAEFNNLFESGGNKNRTLPEWAKGLLFCAPWIIGFLIFTLYPLIQTLIFSFSRVDISPEGFQATSIGFANYTKLFAGNIATDTLNDFRDYIVEMVVYVPLITIFSLMLAMLLNTKIKVQGFFRVLFFFPVIITSGPVIKILIEQGVTSMPGINTLMDVDAIMATLPDFARTAFNILTSEFTMILWFSGIQILVFITALQKIDKGVYEASAIDGAGKWEQFWKVTLPAINPTIIINVVFTLVMQSIFALNPIILKIRKYMSDTNEGMGYGLASALAYTYFILMIVLLVIFVLIFKKHEKRNKEVR